MESQRRQGLEVRAFSPLHSIPEERSQPIAHLPIMEFDLATKDPGELALEAAAGERTVFHFHGLSAWSDRTARLLKEKSIPYVFTSHGQLHFHGLVHGLKKLVYLNALDRVVRDASGLHFLTRRERDRSSFILPSWRKPVLVQPNLVEVPDAQSVAPASRDALGIPADAFVLAYLGRLDVRHKGLDVLLRAFAEVSRGAKARLLFIGPDFRGGKQALDQIARDLGCDGQVHFTGPRIGPAKWEMLKVADAFASPSRWEACSISQAEAIGFGLPTIVSNQVNMASEWAADGVALVSPLTAEALAGAIRQVMTDPALRAALSRTGQQWAAETCAYGPAGVRFAAFYEAVLAK